MVSSSESTAFARQSMPIGEPMEGSRILICSSGGLAGIGEPGEIYFGGDFIARGYLGMPELTKEKFVLDRFPGAQGTRLYASGDLARRGAKWALDRCLPLHPEERGRERERERDTGREREREET